MAGALKEALGLDDFADETAVAGAIGAAVAGEEHAAAIARNLESLLGASAGGSAEEINWAIRRFLEALAREHPLVVVFDDIHWGEPAFHDLVEHVADWSRGASILLLCMARPELLDVRPAWAGGKTNATTISLAPLTQEESGRLVDLLLGSAALPDGVRGRITRVAGGNPLFVEEMLRMLVDERALVRDGEAWMASAGIGDVHVPPTISALLSARLDRLTDDERAIVEVASVEGQEFQRGAVLALLPDSARAGVDGHLRTLVRRELIGPERSRLPGDDAYRFRHILIRDAAYDAIPKAERSRLHVAFADWLEGVAGDRVAEQQEILGYHLERAYRYREELGLPDEGELRLRAGRALGEAGELAYARADVRASAALLRAASSCLRGDRAELEVLGGLAFSLWSLGETEASTRAVRQLAEAADLHADPVSAMRARFLLRTGEVLAGLEPWDLDETSRLCQEASDVYRIHGATRHLPDVVIWQSIVAWERGDSVTLAARAREAVELSARLGGGALASSLNSLCAGLAGGPLPLSDVLVEVDALLAAFPDNPWIETTIRDNRAGVLADLGLLSAAKAQRAEVRAAALDLGLWQVAEGMALLDGVIAWADGDLDTAEGRLHAAIEFMEAHGLGFNTVFAGGPLARILLDRGREADAAAVVRQLQQRFGPPYRLSAVPGLSIGGVLAARRGDFDEALRLSDSAVALLSTMDFVVFHGDVALDRAEILWLAGRCDEARASAADALERYEGKEHAIGIRRARALLASLPGLGDSADEGRP